MKINITQIDENLLQNESIIKFWFNVEDVDKHCNLTFEVYDPHFNIKLTGDYTSYDNVSGINYWVMFEIDPTSNNEKPTCKLGFRLVVKNDFGKIIYDEVHLSNKKLYKLRPNSENDVMWIIGDSNVWSSFGYDNFKYDKIGKYKPVRVSVTSLSLNRFVKSDYIEFLRGLPFRENDCLVFYLGEIDFRLTIHKYVSSKNTDLETTCNDLLTKYHKSLQKIQNEFKLNTYVLSPNPPMRDNFHSEDYMVLGTEKDRIKCFEIFDEYFKNQKDIRYINWTTRYTNIDKLIKTEYLSDGDHHIVNHEIIKKEVESKLNLLTSEKSNNPKNLIDYCLNDDLMVRCVFMQVYEEILTLMTWLNGFKPHNILEIGTMGSTFWLISKLSTGKKVSLDIEPRDSIIHHFMYGEEWKFFVGNSQTMETFEKVKDFCPQYDFIFIDGDHTYDGVKKDFELYKNLLSPRGVIAFHDIDPDHIFADSYAGQVYKFWQDLDEGTKINIVCKKSSGKIKLNGQHSQGFGGIGLWMP